MIMKLITYKKLMMHRLYHLEITQYIQFELTIKPILHSPNLGSFSLSAKLFFTLSNVG